MHKSTREFKGGLESALIDLIKTFEDLLQLSVSFAELASFPQHPSDVRAGMYKNAYITYWLQMIM